MAKHSSVEDIWLGLNILTCNHCHLRTSDSSIFQAHPCKPKSSQITAGVSYNREKNSFICSLCKLELPELEFSQHLESHVSLKPYVCKYCREDFTTTHEMFKHLKQYHGNDVLTFLLKFSVKTKEIMQKAKNNGTESYKAINNNVISDHSGRFVPANINSNSTPLKEPVTDFAQSQKTANAPLLSHSISTAVGSKILPVHINVPAEIQPVSLAVCSPLTNQKSPNASTFFARPQFSPQPQRLIILSQPIKLPQSGSLPLSSAQILQTQAPVSLPCVPLSRPELTWTFSPSSRIAQQTSGTSNSNNLPVVVQTHAIETQMESPALLSSVNKVHSTLQPPVTVDNGHLGNGMLLPSRVSLSHQNVVEDHRNTDRTVLDRSSTESEMEIHNNIVPNIVVSSRPQEVPNSSAPSDQGSSLETIIKKEDSTAVKSDWPMQIRVENIVSLSKSQDAQQNISSDRTEHLLLTSEETTEFQKKGPENLSYLRVVKGYFLCLICRIKWLTDYDLFFKHIWQKHVHGADFSCCPMGYSKNCVRLKAAVDIIYKNSQEQMSEQIKSYFMTQPCIDFSELKDLESASTIGKNQHQSHVVTETQSTTASMSSRSASWICLQNLPMETVAHSGESNSTSDTTFNPEQFTSAPSHRTENEQNQMTDVIPGSEGGLQDSVHTQSIRLTPREIISSTPEVDENIRCYPEHQQRSITTNSVVNADMSMSSHHNDSNITTNMYEDISNDGCGNMATAENNYFSLDNFYSGDLPLDLSKKASKTGELVSQLPVSSSSVNETPVVNLLTHMERISTESLDESEDDSSLKLFFACGFDKCLFTSSKSLELNIHNQQEHETESEYPCVHCGCRSTSSEHLIQHMEKHFRNNKTKTFSCSLLENSDKVAQFENNDEAFILKMLKTSLSVNSESDAVLHFACNICQSEFAVLEELGEHLQESLLTVFECKHCESYFLNSFSCQKHMAAEHIDMPQVYNVNKKLLCYDIKISKKVCDVSSQGSKNIFQQPELEIAVQEEQFMDKTHQLMVADNTDTRVLGNKSESNKVNENIHVPEVQCKNDERITMVLPLCTKNKNIHNQQVTGHQESGHLVMSQLENDLTFATSMNTLELNGGGVIGDNFQLNSEPQTVSGRSKSDGSGQYVSETVNCRNNNNGQVVTEMGGSDGGQAVSPTVSGSSDSDDEEQPVSPIVGGRSDSDNNEQPVTPNVGGRSDSDDNEQPVSQTVSGRSDNDDNKQSVSSAVCSRGENVSQTVTGSTYNDGNGQPVSSRRDSEGNKQPAPQESTVCILPNQSLNSPKNLESPDSRETSAKIFSGKTTAVSDAIKMDNENGNISELGSEVLFTDHFGNCTSNVLGNIGTTSEVRKSLIYSTSPENCLSVNSTDVNIDTNSHPVQKVSNIGQQENLNLVLDVNGHDACSVDHTIDPLVMDNESLTVAEGEECINSDKDPSLPVTEATNAENVITNSLGMSDLQKTGLVELICRKKTVLPDKVSQMCTRINGGPYSLPKALWKSVNADPLQSSDQHLDSNLDSVKNSNDQTASVRGTVSNNEHVAGSEKDDKQSKVPSPSNTYCTRTDFTQATETDNSLVLGELEVEDHLSEIALNSAKNTDSQPVSQQGEENTAIIKHCLKSKDGLPQIGVNNIYESSANHLRSDRSGKSEGLVTQKIIPNQLTSDKYFPARSSVAVNTVKPDLTSVSSNNNIILEENNMNSVNPSSHADNRQELQVPPGSSRDKISSPPDSAKSIGHDRSLELPQPMECKNNYVPNQYPTVLLKKTASREMESNISNFRCIKCGSPDRPIVQGDYSEPNTDQLQNKPVSVMCKRCLFLEQWSSFQSRKTNTSPQPVQEPSSANQSLLIPSTDVDQNKNEPIVQRICRLIDECGSTALDQYLKPLFTSTDGKFVCKKCRRIFISLKRVHCHVFHCQGKVGVVHCSQCLHQGEHEKVIVSHIKSQHLDSSVKTTVSYRYLKGSELMEILNSHSTSTGTFLDICAKLSIPKHAIRKDGNVPKDCSSKKLAVYDNAPKDCIISEKENSILAEHQLVPLNSAEEQAEPVLSVNSENRLKISTSYASKYCEEQSSVISSDDTKKNVPVTDNSVIFQSCTKLSVISGNAGPPVISKNDTHNLSTNDCERGEENKTPTSTMADKKHTFAHSDALTKALQKGVRSAEIHNKEIIAAEIHRSSEVQIGNNGLSIQKKSQHAKNERIMVPRTCLLARFSGKDKVVKEKSEDCLQRSRESDSRTVCKQSEGSDGAEIGVPGTLKKIMMKSECSKANKTSEITKPSGETMAKHSESAIKASSTNNVTVRAPEIISSDTKKSSPDRKDMGSKISESTQPHNSVKLNTELKGKFADTNSVGRTALETRSNMNNVRHIDTPGKMPSNNNENKDFSIPDTSGSTKQFRGNNVAPVVSHKIKIPNTEIANNVSNRKSENGCDEEGRSENVKSDKIRFSHFNKALESKEKPDIGNNSTTTSDKKLVKCSDVTSKRESKDASVRSDENIEDRCSGIVKAPSRDGHTDEIEAAETRMSYFEVKMNCNDARGKRHSKDRTIEAINTPQTAKSDKNVHANDNHTERKQPDSAPNKVSDEAIRASESAELGGDRTNQISSPARTKSVDSRLGGGIGTPETTKLDKVKLECNDKIVRSISEGGHKKVATDITRSSQETHKCDTTFRQSESVLGWRTLDVIRSSKEIETCRSDSAIKELVQDGEICAHEIVSNDKAKRSKSQERNCKGMLTTENTHLNTQISNSHSPVKRKLLDGEVLENNAPETSRSAKEIKISQNDTSVATCDKGINLLKTMTDDKETNADSDTVATSQLEVELNCENSVPESKSSRNSPINCAAEKLSDTQGSVTSYKCTKDNGETSVTSKTSAVKRKIEGFEVSISKHRRSEGIFQSITEMGSTDLSIPASTSCVIDSVKISDVSSNPELKQQTKSPSKLTKVVGNLSDTEPDTSNGLTDSRKHAIYKCRQLNCDFTTSEWNIDIMKGHINSKHPYYSCGYCKATYTLLSFLHSHQQFLHQGMKPYVVAGTISLHLLFKKIDYNSLHGDGHSRAKHIGSHARVKSANSTQSLTKSKMKKSGSKAELTTSKTMCDCTCDTEENMVRNQEDVPIVGNKIPSGIQETYSEVVDQPSISKVGKSHVDKISQSQSENILDKFLSEFPSSSRHEEILSKTTSIKTASNNVNSISAKTDRNLFEGTSFMNNVNLDVGVSVVSQTAGSKLINTSSVQNNAKVVKSSNPDKPQPNIFNLKLPIVDKSVLQKTIQYGSASSAHSQPVKLKEYVNKDLNEPEKLSQYSAVLKAAVSLENLPPQSAIKDAFKKVSASLSSIGVHNQAETKSKSAYMLSKCKKVPKFRSAAAKCSLERGIPESKVGRQNFSSIDYQASNLSARKSNSQIDQNKSKADTTGINLAANRMLDNITTPKVMAPKSSLRAENERNCGAWTDDQLETKAAAEGSKNKELEPENMRITFVGESIHSQNISKASCNSKSISADLSIPDKVSHKIVMSKTDYPFRCTVCRKIAKCLNDIEDHFKKSHPRESVKLTERRSGFVYSSSGQCLQGKDHRNAPTLIHNCRYCSFRSSKRSDVETHILDHPRKNVQVFSLRKPGSPMPVTTTPLSETAKVQVPTGSYSVTYCCNMCSSIEKSEFMFRLHLATHPGFKHTSRLTTYAGFVCHKCYYVAKSNSDLAQHTGEHMSERRFKCSMCDHDSHNKKGVRTHIRSVHNINTEDNTWVIDRDIPSNFKPRLVNINPQVSLERIQSSS